MHALGTAAAAAAEEEEVALRRVRRRRRRRRLSYTQVLGASVHPSPPHRPGGPRSTAAASHSSTCIQPIKTDLMMKVGNDVIRTPVNRSPPHRPVGCRAAGRSARLRRPVSAAPAAAAALG